MAVGVSVIICTYNGSARLPETLRHLALQVVPESIPWEVILIDNASGDNTSITAKVEWGKYNIDHVGFKVLQEDIPGKNFAFTKGVSTAAYEYILTCDDDNWLSPNYIETAFDIMQTNPSAGVLGGCGVFEPGQPVNLEIEKFKHYYVNGSQKWASIEHWVYGAGSICRKSIFINLINNGWKQITTGRKGSSLICGEDVEICFMIYLSGYKIITDERLLFKHFVDPKKQNKAYIIKMAFWLSYTNVLLNSYYTIIHKDKRPIKKILDDWFWGISKTLIKQLILQSFKSLKIWEKPTTEQKIAVQSIRGTFYALLQNRKKIVTHHYLIKKILSLNN